MWPPALSWPVRVYPRAGGGTSRALGTLRTPEGLSPRRRGNRGPVGEHQIDAGSIPAQAGEPSALFDGVQEYGVYPRAGGGTQAGSRLGGLVEGLSPRRRGNRLEPDFQRDFAGSIPAQAGKPWAAESSRRPQGSIPAQAGEP